jgi:hypothetical protein
MITAKHKRGLLQSMISHIHTKQQLKLTFMCILIFKFLDWKQEDKSF